MRSTKKTGGKHESAMELKLGGKWKRDRSVRMCTGVRIMNLKSNKKGGDTAMRDLRSQIEMANNKHRLGEDSGATGQREAGIWLGL